MTAKTLEIGGVVVPLWASMEIAQTYERLGGSTVLRMMSGAAKKQTHWGRLATRVSGTGNVPAGLDGIDWSQPQVLKCAAARSIGAAGNVIAIPAARRSDAGHLPHGFAENAAGVLAATPVALAGDVATLTPVGGAVRYLVLWYPQLTVFSDGPAGDIDVGQARYGWELRAEEV